MSIPDYSNTPDHDLLALFKTTGSNETIGVLFKRYSHLVYGVCNKYLKDEEAAKDAVMQIFEKLLKDINKHDIQEFKPWIYTVAKNHCFMILRAKPKEISGQENDFMEKQAFLHLPVEPAEELNEKQQQLQKLDEAISQLDEHQRTCIELFFIHEKSYQEISDSTGYDLNKVKSYIQNGKRNLKILLEKWPLQQIAFSIPASV